MNDAPIITVDGPSGTGKGTLCTYIAYYLKWNILDSGVFYRALALLSEKQRVLNSDEIMLQKIAKNLDIKFEVIDNGNITKIFLDGELVNNIIRMESYGKLASIIASIPSVREVLLDKQRKFHAPPGLVADGRDMGTVVFPNADLKIYLTASVEERAKRRYKQLKDKGVSANLRSLYDKISFRDDRDGSRAVSPMKPADDAIIIDTSNMDVDAVIAKILKLIEKTVSGVVNKKVANYSL